MYLLTDRAPDDATLVRQLIDREPASVAQLFDRYGDLLRRVTARVLGGPSDVDDLVQDALLIVIDKVRQLQKPEALRSFAVSIALRLARNELRKRSLRRFVRMSEAPPPSVPHRAEARHADALRAVYGVLDQLDATSRTLFVMRYVEGWQLEELAEAHDCSLATVKRRLAKSNARFRAIAERNPALEQWLREET